MLDTLLLKARSSVAIRGVSALASMKYFTKFLTLLRLAIVARILGPEPLGLFGLSVLIISITEVFSETGINIVLLKKPERFAYYYDTAWVVSLIRGVLIAATILLLSPIITTFYGQSELLVYLLVAASIPFVRGWINPAIVLFQQKLQFGNESLLRVVLQLTDLLAGLLFVLWWQSGIGLLVGILLSVLLEVVLSFMLFADRPSLLKAQWTRVKELYRESKFIIGNSIVHYLTENIDDFLIGKLLGFSALGVYQTAYKLASAATMDFASIIGQTLYPIYAKMTTQRESVQQLLIRSNTFMALIFLAASVPFLFFTEPLVSFVLGPEWLLAVPVVRILFIAGVVKAYITTWNPISILAENLHHHFFMNLIMMAVMIVGIVVFSTQWGLIGASYAILVAFSVIHPYAWFVVYQALQRLQYANEK